MKVRLLFLLPLILSLQTIKGQTLDTITICNGDSVYIYNNWESVTGNYPTSIGVTTLIVNPTPTITGNFILNGNATQPIPNTYQLTQATNGQSGSAWNSVTLNLTQPFSFDVDMFFGYNNGGADGIAFLLQQVSTIVGTSGGGIGYQGIAPSFCVEFDTWQNGMYSDPWHDHLAVQKNGDLNHTGPNNLVPFMGFPPGNSNIEDGQWHNVVFSWDPSTFNFQVVFDGTTLVNYNNNIVASIFGNNPYVYWGFTAATGGANNLQQFRVNSLGVQLSDITICQYDTVQIDPQINTTLYSYLWTPNYNISNDTAISPLFSPDTTTTYFLEITNSYGCSNIDSLTIFVDTPTSNLISLIACDSYTWSVNGQTYTTSGTYTDISSNAAGCTHTDTLNLTINNSTSNNTTVTQCDAYTWPVDGQTYTTSGTYTDISTNAAGCVHIDSLFLTINNSFMTVFIDTACGEYPWQGVVYTNSGIYTNTLTSIDGCDSVVTLELTIFEDSSVTYITFCDSAQWNGVWYYNDTIVTDTGFVTTTSFGGASIGASGKEGNIWYFGYNAGLDFNSGSPVLLSNGQLNTYEGCATIADNNGDLLFYTDGMTVYNKNHTIMLNGTGLLGHTSSAQSSIIIKKPGSTIIYYIFTVDGVSGNAGGLNYSEVDMTLDGGLGDINSNKNIPIFSNACEKVTAVKHQNGTDLWVVSRLENSNTYHSYLLTSMGLNTTPVINNIGQVYNGSFGYLKASSDGSKVAAANKSGVATVDIMDFNNLTGILSNLITINHSGGLGPYGIEFSSNNNILYFSDFSCLYQVNLLAGSVTNIINSVISLGCAASPSALQMAPDQKIYIANENSTFLGVISNPDILGSGSNVNITSINLTPASSGLGLPTFFSSIFNSPPSGCDSVATAIITITNSNDIDVEIDENQVSCFGGNDGFAIITPTGGIDPYTYLWSDGQNTNSATGLSSGNYPFTVTDAIGCHLDSFVIISEANEIFLDFIATSPICRYDESILSIHISNSTSNIYTISLQDSILNSFVIDTNGLLISGGVPITLTPNFSGEVYIVTLTDDNGCEVFFNDNVHIEVKQLPDLFLNEVDICVGQSSYTLNKATPIGGTYFINDVMTDYFDVENLEIGGYNIGYEYTDPITLCYNKIEEVITINESPTAGLFFSPQPTDMNNPDIFFRDNSNDLISSVWDLGDGTIIYDELSFWHTYSDIGTYIIRYYITNQYNCTDSVIDNLVINPVYNTYIPTAFTPNDDDDNDYFYPSIIGGNHYNMKIYDRWGGVVYNEDNGKWDGKMKDDFIISGVYSYSITVFDFKNKPFIFTGLVFLIK